MKNWTLKNFNFKKATIVCLCLLFALACSSLFAFVQNNKIENVNATNGVEQLVNSTEEEYDVQFGENHDGEITPFLFENSASGNYTFTITPEISSDTVLEGGAYFQLTQNSTSITLYKSDGTLVCTVTVNPASGYEFESYVFDDGDDSTESITWAPSQANKKLTFEEIDVNFTGNIVVKANCPLIPFDLDLFYENNLGAYSKHTEARAYANSDSEENKFNFTTDILDGKSDLPNKNLTGWLFNYSNVSDYSGYSASLNTSNSTISLSGSGFAVTFTLESQTKIQGVNGDVYYLLQSVYGSGKIVHNANNPLIIAQWTNTYTVTIDNSKTYWTGFEDTKNNSELFGVGVGDTCSINALDISISKNTPYPFMDSVNSNNGLAFKKLSELQPADKAYYTAMDGTFPSYFVYNYGHYISHWDVKAVINGGTYYWNKTAWLKIDTQSETETQISIENLSDVTFENMSITLDNAMSGTFGLPTKITLTPIWNEATINTDYSSSITFARNYTLTGGSVNAGQTLFAYTYDEGENLVATAGIWNYQNIEYEKYPSMTTENENYLGDKYSIALNGYGLDNVYKITLNDARTNDDGNYELETDDYTYYDSTEKITNDVIDYNWFETLAGYNATNYPLIDNYVSYLQGYKEQHLEHITGDSSLFNKVHFSTGTLDGSILSATNPTLWIYLANNQNYKDLPMFKTKYYTTILWQVGGFDFITSAYLEGDVSEGEQNYSAELTNENSKVEQYQFTQGTSATAKYVNKLNLYYMEDDASEYSYVTVKHFSTKIPDYLDFSQTMQDYQSENYVYGGWVFNSTVAKEDYGYAISGTIANNSEITVTNGSLSTVLYISEVNNTLYYVTKVKGDVLIQEDDNPIITMKKANKLNVIIDNTDTYWTSYASTKDNNDLYGAKSSEGGGDYTTTFVIADNSLYAYPIMTSEVEKDGEVKGLSFFHDEDFSDSYRANVGDKYYYVYNYGHYITGYKITFKFASSEFDGVVLYISEAFYALQGTSTDFYEIDDATSNYTLRDIAKLIDDYMLGKGITEVPTVTMIPVWEKATINVSVKDGDTLATEITFGEEYTLANDAVTAPTGQSLFAYSYGGLIATNETNDAIDGRWNYQNISASCFTDYTTATSIGAGAYTIELTPYYVDNIYKITLSNATTNESGVYQLVTNTFELSNSTLISELKFDDVSVIDSNYEFNYYQSADLIDDYISELNSYRTNYSAGIKDGKFSIFNKVYTSSGTIGKTSYDSDTLTISSTPNLFIYLANNQSIGDVQLPEFAHDLSMLIYWQNDNGNNAYTTSKYDNSLYAKELTMEDKEGTHAWALTHGGAVGNLSLTAAYVYSIRMYSYNTDTKSYDSVNIGNYDDGYYYFGKNTSVSLLNEKNEFNITPAQIPADKKFERWIFNLAQAQTEGYSVVNDETTKALTVTKDSDEWIFTYSGTNAYSDSIYYITGITSGYTRFIQNSPIIYAKWTTEFDLTIDTSNTYWSNFSSTKNNELYGAYSEVLTDAKTEPTEFYKTTFKIANIESFAYPFMTSQNSNNDGLSFYHLEDWETEDAQDNAYATAMDGYYYVFNYGHYISGWEISLTTEGKTYYFTINSNNWSNGITSTPGNIDINNLLNTNLQALSAEADEFMAQFINNPIATLKMVPIWKETNINVAIDKDYAYDSTDLILASNITFASDDGYTINNTKAASYIDKSIIHYYYGDAVADDTADVPAEKMIASTLNANNKSGIWNYKNIPASEYDYSAGTKNGSGIYTIELIPYYVDNIYKVNLNNAQNLTKDSNGSLVYRLENCDFEFNANVGGYLGSDLTVLTFLDNVDANYSFTAFNNETFIDEYINDLQDYKNGYLAGIKTENSDCFDIFKKVYHSAGIVGTNSYENDTLTVASEPNFYIYLANNQNTGALPMFKKDSYSLILWKNINLDYNGNQFIYPTSEYDSNSHKEEIGDYKTHTDSKGDFTYVWKYLDGYDKSDNSATIEAVYYLKSYEIQIFTVNKDNNDAIERRGYVRLKINNTSSDDTIKDSSGDYLIIFNGTNMSIYNYSTGSIIDNADFMETKNAIPSIKFYGGCEIEMYIFDQSQDPTAMATGLFDDMIGYKFSKSLVHKVVTTSGQEVAGKEFFGDANENNPYVYSLDAETIENKEYSNENIIQVYVQFERIVYDLTFQIDNKFAGEFSVLSNGTSSGYKTKLILNNVSVQNVYKMDYFAYAGFKLENNAFVIHNGISTSTLQTYNENENNISQTYLITGGYYKNSSNNPDNSLDGTWLRLYFYSDYTDYDVLNTNIGTLVIETCPIEFTFGVKIYDDSNLDHLAEGHIIETPSEYDVALSLNETTGVATTPAIYTYLNNELGFYYYISTEDVNYALLSSRMFFPKNHISTTDNFYTTYSFLLTEKPINQSALTSTHLSYMVTNFEQGKIISVNDRNIYIMLEVRKLLAVDMSVAQLENDSNSTIRTTTLNNADNNSISITIEPGAETDSIFTYDTSAILGYFKTSTGKTVIRAYTYFGLENILSSSYDSARYSKVEYILNGSATPLRKNNFVVEEDSSLLIKYLPQSISVDLVYMLEGSPMSDIDAQTYIMDTNIYKPNAYSSYHIGDYVTYLVECVHPDYDLSVIINDTTMGSTDSINRKVQIVKYQTQDSTGETITIDNRYLVTNNDFTKGKIEIVVDVRLRSSGIINLKYQLQNSSKKTETDDYGTFSVYEEDNTTGNIVAKEENIATAKVLIIEGRDVYIQLNIPAGYIYVGIKQGSNSIRNFEIDANGLIKLVGDFNPETHSGDYLIIIDKESLTAVLDTTNVNKNSNYSMMNYTKNSEWSKNLTGLYVGSVVAFKAEVSIEERLAYFYYLDKDDSKIEISNDETSKYVMITITSEMLENVNSAIIEFGVEVVARFKLDLKVNVIETEVTGEDYIKENGLSLEVFETGEEYISGQYVDTGTVIALMVETEVTGKYNINVKETPDKIEKEDFDIINKGDVLFTLDQNYICEITVSPKLYQINVEENLYTHLLAVRENAPDTSVEKAEQVNALQSSGQHYNANALITFVRKTEDRELSTVFISNNDNEDNLMIVFSEKAYTVYKIVEDGENEVVNLKDYGFTLTLTETNVNLTYVTYSNVDIRFDYKLYKVIQA